MILQETWNISKSHDTDAGRKVYYRCTKVKKSATDCPCSVYLLYHCDNEAVSLYRTSRDHCHDQNAAEVRGISLELRPVIRQLYDDKVQKPKAIIAALRLRGLPEPKMDQLTNFLQKYKEEKFGKAKINLGELEEWCQERSTPLVQNTNDAYVVCFTTDQKESMNPVFRIFISSLRLLQAAPLSDIVHVDATYKLNWQGFPVMVIGTSDKDRKFWPLGAAVCSSETSEDFRFIFQSLVEGVSQVCNSAYSPSVLVADASAAISKGFREVFGDDKKRVFCWAHAIRAMDGQLKRITDKKIRQRLRDDIVQLQLSISPEVFAIAKQLFLSKWSAMKNQEITNFLTYFTSEWIDKNGSWYEGYAIGSPSTNNCLEAVNLTIKTEQTLRDRLPIARFMNLLMDKILRDWSLERDPLSINHKKFEIAPTKSLALWTLAYQWATGPASLLVPRKQQNADGSKLCYAAASGMPPVTSQSIAAYRAFFSNFSWQSFDQYVISRNSMWVVKLTESNWESASCTCQIFLKEYICKHILGIAIRLKYCDIAVVPAAAKSVPIGEKRKKGRPKNKRFGS